MRSLPSHRRDARADDAQRSPDVPQPAPVASSLLALQRSAGNAAVAALLQRQVKTSGGEWSTDKYDLLKDVDQNGNPKPAAAGIRGAEMELRFKPDASTVDAELIGLTQSVLAFISGAPSMTPSQAAVAIPHAEAKDAGTGPGETDEGAAIDQLGGYNSPLYATKAQTSASLEDAVTNPQWGQHGFHYTDSSGVNIKHQDALLKDKPMRGGAAKDARHIFETAALATKGTQAGTYYGSVRWGWRTDSTGAFSKVPLEVVSEGVPSSTFMKAAEIWNKGTSTTGGVANLKLPTVDVKVATTPITIHPPIPYAPVVVPKGTRLAIVSENRPPVGTVAGSVRVVDGPHFGCTGEVTTSDWAMIVDERS